MKTSGPIKEQEQRGKEDAQTSEITHTINKDKIMNKKESKWVKEIERVLARKPDSLNCYITDGNYLFICKVGEPCTVGGLVKCDINAGTCLIEMHDYMDFGIK